MLAREEIDRRVVATLAESLAVDASHVTPSARLRDDLDAESIDFLDIVFRLEREFGIKIPRGELFPEAIFQGDPEYVQDGRVTDAGLVELRKRMPFADLSEFEKDPVASRVADLFTVDLISRYVCAKLGTNSAD